MPARSSKLLAALSASALASSSRVVLQQKHRDLSGQAEQLHLVCQSHKDRIKSLFQTKLDEVCSDVPPSRLSLCVF